MDIHLRLPVHQRRLAVILLSLWLLAACKQKSKLIEINPEFSKYIEAYTSGVVSKKNAIRIQLATDAGTTHSINETVKETLFEFSPSVPGKAYWIDARTIEFKPEKDLQPDAMYEVDFRLGRVLNVPDRFKNFKFNVQVVKPSFQVTEFGLRGNGKEDMSLSGQLVTADVEESAKVEKLLNATLNNSNLKITWQHNETSRTHDFIINSIKRVNSAGNILLAWNGEALGVDISGKKDIPVPAIGDFTVLGVRAVQDQEQYALVQFSDPLTVGQALEGLISISNQESVSYAIMGSEVKVYTSDRLDGAYSLNVHEGIENMWGDKLAKAFTSNVYFENRLPSVKIHGRGEILPNSGGRLVLPFESVNLNAVDVSIVKIYEENVAQFLQTNDLNGGQELRRVAKPLVKASIRLDNDKSLNLHKKNRFSLDLDKYIRTEPGAIYRVFIGFKPEYSLYTCTEVKKSGDDGDEDYYNDYDYSDRNELDEDEAFWNNYDSWYPYGYNWSQRDNPCSRAYYNKERFAYRNILASNIGLTAKRGNGSLLVAVSNIINTEPLGDVQLEVLDYQRQVIGKASSGSDGIALVDVKRKPYLLVAKRGSERGYLKLDDGSSLALSRFDIDGAEVKNGIKGFIFGERGVWRPGDSLYLSCIIEDKDKKLPKDHPIEMELVSPRGQLYKRIVQTNADDGFNIFKTVTDPEAPTGNWTCKIKLGGNSFEKKLKIETVMPNRLKINLDFGNLQALGKDADANGTLTAKWLFGATAQNLKARVDAQLYKKTTSFSKFKDYVFDNPTSSFSAQSKTIFDGTLNAEGTALVNPSFTISEAAPGQLLANMVVKVFEPGGNFSIDNISMPFNPYSSYVGVRVPEGDRTWGYLATGKTHKFDIADVNTDGEPLSGTSNVEVEMYKIQWRWWWDNSGDDLSNFTQNEYNKLLRKETVSLSNGRGNYNVHIDDDNWGRYLILIRDSRSGHVTGKTFFADDDSWRSRSGEDNDRSAVAMLSFTADKDKYNVGDEVKLTIPGSKGGRALISIETGSKVLKTYWVPTEQGQTKFSFKTEKEMSPNIYVNVSLIQPHAQTLNDLPIRMYGVIPILVEDKNTLLKPVIKMADVIRPEEKSSITVSEASGKSMTYVVAIVDEGLLDLTPFKTPNPHDAFYAKEALGVKSWDIYDEVIGAWGSELERILTIGGDAEAELASKTRRANRFKPVVQFMGPFKTGGGSKTHSFTLPSYMGSVRAMVIAAGNNAYGMAEKAVKVKKPLMMLATLPRVLGPGEELKIPVTIFATENNIKNVTVSLQGNNLIETTAGTASNVQFTQTGEQTIYLGAKVKAATGIGSIQVVATSGKSKAVYATEIDVRNPNPVITQVTETTLQPGQSWSSSVAMVGDAGSAKAVLEVSSIPAINLEKRLSYLISYPHGCIEQTTSAVFPQLVLNQLMDLDDYNKAMVDRNVRAGIQKLLNFQQSDGGFSYWPGYGGSDEWGSNYAGHFLMEASAAGYNVPASMMQLWKQYQRNQALAWNVTSAPWYGTDLSQAYRLYLLALAKAPELGAMNRLKEFKFITPEAKWRLAAAYHLMGQSQVALKLISGLPTSFPVRPFPGVTFGSDLRDQAMVLETLTIMKRKAEAEVLVKNVAMQLAKEDWYSTQTTAYALIAIAKFSGNNKDNRKIVAAVNAGGQSANVNSNSVVSQTNIKWQGNKASVQLTNKGGNVLYVRIINQGKPFTGDSITVSNNPQVLVVNASYIDMNGNAVNPVQLKQGTDFVAKITVRNPGFRGMYNEMALSQIFPGGWEILNTRLYNSEGTFQSSPSEYMDIRDDRVYHYFDIKQGETLTYYVQLNAAYPGKYYWPGVYCEAMYDHTISGGTNGKWINVE
ncbi:alpha-2-macroglobulin family protein [Foetidibacter luteolus]|uniref:alpha-2-macroglobulin family protein n=1 Tax=Foetidibacter luteolus TaxID=2608880 RepID=UPI00129A6AC6|nr:MG2 domain-containing protein [Foetidibacter luteolus]